MPAPSCCVVVDIVLSSGAVARSSSSGREVDLFQICTFKFEIWSDASVVGWRTEVEC